MKKEIGVYVDRTYKVVRQDLINRFKKAQINLTPEQWVLLNQLDKSSMSQADLAAQSFKDRHTVSRILDLLQKKGFLSRTQDLDDARRYLITLTDLGISELNKAKEHVYASRDLGWQNISEKEYQQLKLILDKIFFNYSK